MRRAAAWLFTFAVAAPLAGHGARPLAETNFAAGQAAYEQRDFAAARRIWSDSVRAGDAEAALSLGLLYDLGDGGPEDPARAFQCYLTAANAGLPVAEFNTAIMLDSGRGTAQDRALAATWYARAAAHQHARADYDLAQLYALGEGVPKNPDQSAQWYRAAAAGGIAAARLHLATRGAARPSPAGTMPALQPPIIVDPSQIIVAQNNQAQVELVWVAPEQPTPTHFFLIVVRLDANGGRELVSRSTTLSSAIVDLPDANARYAFCVYAVADDQPHYAASTWSQIAPQQRRAPAARSGCASVGE